MSIVTEQRDIKLPPFSDEMLKRNVYHKNLKVSPMPAPSLRVQIERGHYWLGNQFYIEFRGGISPDFELPNKHAYWALLSMDSKFRIPQITYGETANNDPQPPECPSEELPLAWVYLESTDTKITHKNLFDARPFLTSQRHLSADALIEGGGTGQPLFEITPEGLAKFYSLAPGNNIYFDHNNDEITIHSEVVVDYDQIDFDMGAFTDP